MSGGSSDTSAGWPAASGAPQNRAKARAKVARQHARVADARRDFLHKASTDLVRRFDVIAAEDLNVAGMVRNHSLARAITRTGWAEFRAMLEYKAERYGRTVVAVDRWYPSSKTCSACGHLLATSASGPATGRPRLRHPARPGHQRRSRTYLPPGWRRVPETAPMPAEAV